MSISNPTSSSDARSPGIQIRWWVLAITSMVLVLNYADRAAFGVAGSEIIKEFGFTKTEFGLISSIFFFGYAPFCFIGGWLADKYGPRVVMGGRRVVEPVYRTDGGWRRLCQLPGDPLPVRLR